MSKRYRMQQSKSGSWHIEKAVLGGLFWRPIAVRSGFDRAVEFLRLVAADTDEKGTA